MIYLKIFRKSFSDFLSISKHLIFFCTSFYLFRQENAAVREKKRKSREAKQARLETLSQLGVSTPRPQNAALHDSYRQRPYPLYSSMAPSSVTRSQYQIASTSHQGMMPPSLPQQGLQHNQQEPDRSWQSQTPQSQYVSPQTPQDMVNSAHLTRRRGATVGGFEKIDNETQSDYTSGQRGSSSSAGNTNSTLNVPFTPGIEATNTPTSGSVGVLYDVIAPPVTSLSQPATPEATYRFHANMLSSELAATSSASTGLPSPQE